VGRTFLIFPQASLKASLGPHLLVSTSEPALEGEQLGSSPLGFLGYLSVPSNASRLRISRRQHGHGHQARSWLDAIHVRRSHASQQKYFISRIVVFGSILWMLIIGSVRSDGGFLKSRSTRGSLSDVPPSGCRRWLDHFRFLLSSDLPAWKTCEGGVCVVRGKRGLSLIRWKRHVLHLLLQALHQTC
jgi:hypothetical protein